MGGDCRRPPLRDVHHDPHRNAPPAVPHLIFINQGGAPHAEHPLVRLQRLGGFEAVVSSRTAEGERT
jgi:hypothetical protein